LDELCRERQCRVKHQLGQGDDTVFLGFSPQAKEDPGNVFLATPCWPALPPEQLSVGVASLNHAVALQMIGCGVDELYSKHLV
jgi:hypothetical protein